MRNGFTVIEILIVIGISAALVGVSSGAYITLQKRSNVDLEARKLESVLNLARNRTLASEGSKSFGVHITSSLNEYILFAGNTYVATDPTNEIFKGHTGVNLNSPQLFGGGSDVIFERLTGETRQFGSVLLRDLKDAAHFATICIYGNFITCLCALSQEWAYK
jgi:prepilin-type N-terminal cleavage/methylation domain-containing protein